jgi:hypothetical protein
LSSSRPFILGPIAAITLSLLASCSVESNLRIANPEALSVLLTASDHLEPKSATLVTFTGLEAQLTIVANTGADKVFRGHIDMLGVKTWTEYPVRVDFVMTNYRIRFIQPALSDTIRVIDVQR